MRKVAIVGLADANKATPGQNEGSLRASVPWDDPEWEKWVLGWDPGIKAADRVFEIHKPAGVNRIARRDHPVAGVAGYVEWLDALECPVMVQHEFGPRRQELYPFNQVRRLVGNSTGSREPYIESSIGGMIAYALLTLERGDRFGLWGCNMQNNAEYAAQRPNIEYLLGIARGRGLPYYLPAESGICKSAYPGGRYGMD
jgi:hypothetical protein